MKILKTEDQLLGYGDLLISVHEIVDMIYTDQKDWPKRRQSICDYQDRIIGEEVVRALKRGWVASHFDRAFWSDYDREWWTNAPDWVKSAYSLYRPGREGLVAVKGYHIVASCLISRSET
jgi:hypothetical protein